MWPAQRGRVARVTAASEAVWDQTLLHRSLGRVCAASESGTTLSWQTAHPEDRTEAPHAAYADQKVGAQNALLLQISADARPRHWFVCQAL